MGIVRHEISFITYPGISINGTSNYRCKLYPGNYNGTLTWYIELDAAVGTYYIRDSSNNVHATVTVGSAGARTRVAFDVTPTEDTYHIYTASALTVYAARIIIIQDYGATLTASETQSELVYPVSNSTTSYVASAYPRWFYYDSSAWDGTVNFYLNVILKTNNASYTAYAALFDQDDNQVANSEVSTTSTSLTPLRSSALTLTNGKRYCVKIKISNASGQATCYNGGVAVVQSGTITKLQEEYFLSNYKNTTGLCGTPELWDAAEWTTDNVTFKFANDSSSASNDAAKLTDITADPDVDITNASVSGAYYTISTNTFTMPTSGHEIDANVTDIPSYGAKVIAYYVMPSSTNKSGSDSVLPKITESSSLATSESASDSLLPKLSETSELAIAEATNDTLLPKVAEASVLAVEISATDTLLITLGGSSGLETNIPASDTLPPTLGDISGIESDYSGTDTILVQVAESAEIETSITVSDTLLVTLADSSSPEIGVEEKVASDTLLAKTTESSVLEVERAPPDSLIITFTESTSLSVNISVSDSLILGPTESASLDAEKIASDSLIVLLTESASLTTDATEKTASDALAITLTEDSELYTEALVLQIVAIAPLEVEAITPLAVQAITSLEVEFIE